MNTLSEYFSELTAREGRRVRLAHSWPRRMVSSIRRAVRDAYRKCQFGIQPLIVEPGISTPALGNRLEEHVAMKLQGRLRQFKIESCTGQGYPDRQLVRQRDGKAYVLEIKATESFEPTSNNRVVLTSSSVKLQRHFVPPVCHLLLTVCYRKLGRKVWIQDLRTDFLQPDSNVNIRLEASVSHRLLSGARHPRFWGSCRIGPRRNCSAVAR